MNTAPAIHTFDADDGSLSNFLAGRSLPCPQCGYNLRDLQGRRCPECGELLVLRVGIAEPRQGMLIAGLVGLSAVAGFNGLLLAFGLILTMTHGGGGEYRTFIYLGIGLVVSMIAIRQWLFHWRKVRGLPVTTRRWLVVACWLLPVIDIIAMLSLVR